MAYLTVHVDVALERGSVGDGQACGLDVSDQAATRLQISTAAPHVWPTTACPLALLLPVRVASDDGTLVVVSAETGDPIDVVWPAGWAAWRIDGVAELHARDGSLVAREGDVLDDLGGGSGDDGAFHVCIVGS